jgi:uncharacterized membrane protein
MKFCRSCGKKLGDNAFHCYACGEPTSVRYQHKKSKVTAVLLAVFLAQWTWVYTYRVDGWKFWISLLINLIGLFMLLIPNLGVWVWSIIETSCRDKEWYDHYYDQEC